MELKIEKLKKINDQDDTKPKTKKNLPPSDLDLEKLSIAAPEIPVVDESYFSDDGYFSSDDMEEKKAVPVPEEEEEKGGDDVTVDLAEKDRRIQAYTVHVDNHRILTVITHSNTVAARWIREVLRCYRMSEKIIVGVSVDRKLRYEKGGIKDYNYELMMLCVGSQCLIFELPDQWEYCEGQLPLIAFFADPRVVAAGTNMKTVANKLFKDHEIKFSNLMDLTEMAEEVMEDGHLYDFRRYDLDRLGTAVMGRSWYIERPKKVKWYPNYHYWAPLTLEKVMYSTYDAYLCFSIGRKLMEMKSEKRIGGLSGKKNSKKKGVNQP